MKTENNKYNIIWFNEEVFPLIETKYESHYDCFDSGDFGDLKRVELYNSNLGFSFEFWSQGDIRVQIFDMNNNNFLYDRHFEPNEKEVFEEKIEFVLALIFKGISAIDEFKKNIG